MHVVFAFIAHTPALGYQLRRFSANICPARSSLLTHIPADYILTGPLLDTCGLGAEHVKQHFDRWQTLGDRLADQLGFDKQNLSDVEKLRIYHYYLPVFFWSEKQLQSHKASHGGQQAPALVLGISAPQVGGWVGRSRAGHTRP